MSEYLVHTEVFRRYTINVYYDEHADNPREEFDGMGTLILYYGDRNYYIGDKGHDYNIETAKTLWMGEYSEDDEDFSPPSLEEELKRGVVLPVYYRNYGANGAKVWCGPPDYIWDDDGRQSGWIWISTSNIIKEYGEYNADSIERCKKYLEGEIEILSQYFGGDVYCYDVVHRGEVIDSCGGFYGELDYCIESAKNVVRAEYRYKRKKSHERS